MITYQEAISIFTTDQEPKWDRPGTFYVDLKGYENEDFYLIPYGPKEYILDDNPLFEVTDGPTGLVSKTTGEISFMDYLPNIDFFLKFKKV